MNQKTEEEIYKGIHKPKAGVPCLRRLYGYAGSLLEWECLDCNAEGSTEYDDVNQRVLHHSCRENIQLQKYWQTP